MENFGEFSKSGSSSKIGCDGAAGTRVSSEWSVSDRLSADSAVYWLAGTTLSGAFLEAVFSISPML